MTNVLKISLNKDSDGSVALVAYVKSGSFSGSSEAYFNISDLDTFINELRAFIKGGTESATLEGGYWGIKGNMEEVLLSIRFYRKHCIKVMLAEHPFTDCRVDEISKVSVELQPTTNDMIIFIEDLSKLFNSQVKFAVLEYSN